MKPLAVVFWLTIFLSLWSSARTSGAQGTAIGEPAAEPRDTISSDSTEGLQSMLRNTKTAVLNYSLGAGELRLQVITGKESRTFHMATGSVLLSSVIALKTSLQEGAIFDREAAHRLYKKLIMPALPMLTGKTHLVIIPGQITGQIPFETLVPDTGSDRFMLHDYAISYAVSTEALISPGNLPSDYARQKVLAIAPFNMPASEKEIMNIKADHLMGQAASLEGFKRKAGDYAVIHLATYATLNEPHLAFIDFNPGTGTPGAGNPKTGNPNAGNPGANERKDASRLFIRDIPELNLKGVNLVVLSPCPTNPESDASIHDLFKAAEAFASAGCPNFITSMWGTNKEITYKISMKLHQYIHQGYGYAYALQKARIDYLENPVIDASMKSPANWAGFILIGELNTTPRSHKIFYYFALAFAVLVVACILRRKNRNRC